MRIWNNKHLKKILVILLISIIMISYCSNPVYADVSIGGILLKPLYALITLVLDTGSFALSIFLTGGKNLTGFNDLDSFLGEKNQR